MAAAAFARSLAVGFLANTLKRNRDSDSPQSACISRGSDFAKERRVFRFHKVETTQTVQKIAQNSDFEQGQRHRPERLLLGQVAPTRFQNRHSHDRSREGHGWCILHVVTTRKETSLLPATLMAEDEIATRPRMLFGAFDVLSKTGQLHLSKVSLQSLNRKI